MDSSKVSVHGHPTQRRRSIQTLTAQRHDRAQHRPLATMGVDSYPSLQRCTLYMNHGLWGAPRDDRNSHESTNSI